MGINYRPLRGLPVWLRGLIIILVLGFGLYQRYGSTLSAPAIGNGEAAIVEAFDQHRSGLVVEGEGLVERTLADDDQGSRHQRFIVQLASGHSVLISHNIDLAKRLPVQAGDRVRFRGQYEWNERGGVIHWTHHDPQGRRDGGWLELDGRKYK